MLVECLIRVVDKVGTTSRLDAGLTKNGDVILIKPAGWTWTYRNLTNPDWRICRVDIPATLIDALLSSETGSFAHRVNRKHRYRLNINSLPNTIKKEILAPRDTPILDFTAYSSQIQAIVELKGDL